MNKNYPQNLIEDICTGELSKEEVKKNYVYDEDHIKGLEYALSLLPEKMQDIFKKHYIECKTFREIGEHYGVTKARIGQLVQKYLRVLRYHTRFNYIANGYEGELAKQREKETEKLVDEESEKKRMFDKCYENAEEFGKLPVTVLRDKLSTRTINALWRRGWFDKGKEVTLAELDSMSKEELLQIRTLGEKSAKELRDVITELKEHLGIIKTPKVIYKIRSREEEYGECGYEVTVPEGTDEAEVYKNFEMASKYAWVSGADNPEDYDEHFEEMLEVKESCNGEEAFNYYLEKICGYKIESIQYDYDYEW